MLRRARLILRRIVTTTFFLATGGMGLAHCDSLGGPVITEGKKALEKGDVTPVLKWIPAAGEGEVKEAFDRTLEVRKAGGKARELADRWFFETLVRVHRAGEGAPFTGISEAGAEEPAVAAADEALKTGSDEALIRLVTDRVREGIHHRFLETVARGKLSDKSVEDGRRFVESYVGFIHYGEGIWQAAGHKGPHHHS